MRAVRLVLAVIGLAAVTWLLPASLGGSASYVITHGISMEPGFHTGDLAIVKEADEYRVGDVVAYRSEQMNTVVMHRIIAVEDDHFRFKGDNNNFIDVDHPTAADFLGRLAVKIPEGGTWLQRLGSPLGLAVLAFALLASGSATVATRHRRKRRRLAVSRHTSTPPSALPFTFGSLPSSLRVSAGIGAALALLGVVLGVPAWSGPVEEQATSQVTNGQRMDFSYTADVGQSAAYDGTTADSPDPVFRKLTDTVDVHFTYSGQPGTVNVAADLSTPAGWHSSVALAGPETFTGPGYTGTVTLDLKALEAKAQAASEVTGMPAAPLSITVTPTITTAGGAEFQPGLKLNLAPLQLTLDGGAAGLGVAGTSTTDQHVTTQRMLGLNGMSISAAMARSISTVLLLAALATLAVVLVFARRSAPVDEAAAIRRRYSALLVRVHPVTAPHGRPVIDVTTFSTLAKLAERYGLLVLHWTRSSVDTFIVQDENITYRYRAGADPAPADAQPGLVDAGPRGV